MSRTFEGRVEIAVECGTRWSHKRGKRYGAPRAFDVLPKMCAPMAYVHTDTVCYIFDVFVSASSSPSEGLTSLQAWSRIAS